MSNDAKQEHQRPEGRLLERAMAGPPKISGRTLGKMADLSEGRVRQIVNGYKTESGMTLPVVAPAETLVRLGAALGLTAEDFEGAERPDVAEILRGEVTSGVTEEGDLWLLDQDELRGQLREWLERGVESDPPVEPLMLWEMDALLDAAAKKHRDEMIFMNNLVTILRKSGGDGNAENARGSAPTRQSDFGLVADEDETTIEDEQGHDEFP